MANTLKKIHKANGKDTEFSHFIQYAEIRDLDLPFLATGTRIYGHSKNQH